MKRSTESTFNLSTSMCVIITTPERHQRPSLSQLQLCEQTNRHGSGLAWIEGTKVRYEKQLTVTEIHASLKKISGPAIVHFRIASVGRVTPELCHPFPVRHAAELDLAGHARSVLFHNGTWSEWSRYRDHFGISFPRKEPVSDTRVAAALVARFGFEWLDRAAYCRWALLSKREGIQRIGQWVKVGHCHFSNDYWRPHTEPDWLSGFDIPDQF